MIFDVTIVIVLGCHKSYPYKMTNLINVCIHIFNVYLLIMREGEKERGRRGSKREREREKERESQAGSEQSLMWSLMRRQISWTES